MSFSPNKRERQLGYDYFSGDDIAAGVLAMYRDELLAPIIALARKELETGSAVSGGTTLAKRVLELVGEK